MGTINAIERGSWKPSLALAYAISEVLGASVLDLFPLDAFRKLTPLGPPTPFGQKTPPGRCPELEIITLHTLMTNHAREVLCQGRFPASLICVLIVSPSPAAPSTLMPLPSRSTSAGRPAAPDIARLPLSSFSPPSVCFGNNIQLRTGAQRVAQLFRCGAQALIGQSSQSRWVGFPVSEGLQHPPGTDAQQICEHSISHGVPYGEVRPGSSRKQGPRVRSETQSSAVRSECTELPRARPRAGPIPDPIVRHIAP
jgi:hypothetical protein